MVAGFFQREPFVRHAFLAAGLAALMSTTAIAGEQAAAPAAAPAANANPLLATWTGPYGGVPPWDKVKPELFPQAFEVALAERAADYARIANDPARPTFANTFVPM